jgi:hypothetical protein
MVPHDHGVAASVHLQELRGGAGFGLVPDLKAASPAAAWCFFPFHKNFALYAKFL